MIDILKHTIVNVCKSITYGMTKPDKKFFECIFQSMLQYRTPVLSNLGDTKQKKAKDLLKYFSRGLARVGMKDLSVKVEKVLIRFVWAVDADTMFCMDGVDINKNSAKKMEGLKIVRDGSEWTFWNGYIFNAVSVRGIPILFDREEIIQWAWESEKAHKEKIMSTRFRIFSEQVEKIVSLFGRDHWFSCDRLYDDVQKFNLLIEQQMKFVIRLKTSRYVTVLHQEVVQNGERAMKCLIGKKLKVSDIPEGKYTVTCMGLVQPCFLTVKQFPRCKNPIRILSNVDDQNHVERYLKRWEIERVFKSEKQEFNLEKIGTHDIQKTDSLVSLVQLCFGVSAYIHNKLNPIYEFGQEKKAVTTTFFSKHFKVFLNEKWLKPNRNSIIGFIWEYMKKVWKMKYFFKRSILRPLESPQLSLELW